MPPPESVEVPSNPSHVEWGELTRVNDEDAMRIDRQWGPWGAVLLVALVGLTACPYDAAIRQLSPAEQAEFSLYHHRMTGSQEQTYLAKASAAERTAYLRALGLPQRFQALDPVDQQAVHSGWPRVGMSAEALLCVWGEPYYTDGDARRSAHWHYLGSSFGRGASRSPLGGLGNRVDVSLVDGKVVGWVDVAPTTQESTGSCDGC
jgi:hypothetical protein